MRVVQVVNVRWYNATAWYGVNLAAQLQAHGHESMVVGLEGTPPLAKAREMGLETVALPLNGVTPPQLLQTWQGLNRLLGDFRPDVVNCHRGEAFILWALLKKRYGFKLVRTRGDQRLPKNNRVNHWLHCKAADAVIATNSAMARYFAESLQVPLGRLHTILGGVDTAVFKPDAAARIRLRQDLGYTDDIQVVGLVGRLDVVKGIPETIDAVGRVVREHHQDKLRLLLVGFDSQYTVADVARWSAEAGLEGKVLLTGKVERPWDYINAMDLGLVASLGSEAIARAALEIMACRVPLISSSVGVMPDLLPPDSLFAAGDAGAMASSLARFLPTEERAALAEFCFDRIHGVSGLTMDDFYRQTLDVYQG